MGHVPVSFHREKEIRRDRLRPFFKCLRFGQAIKGIVQFNRSIGPFPGCSPGRNCRPNVYSASPRCRYERNPSSDKLQKHCPVKRSWHDFRVIFNEILFRGGFNKPENTPIEPDLDNASEGSKKRFQGFWYKNMPKPFFFTALIYRGRPAIPARGGVGPGWYSPTARRSSRSSR